MLQDTQHSRGGFSGSIGITSHFAGSSSPTTTTVRREGASETTQRRITSTRIAQCTHTNMTRLFSEDFRCALCLRPGSMGWVYRCSQDKEIEMDADVLSGRRIPNFDNFARHFPLSETPRKGTPVARSDSIDFLREVYTDSNGMYTKEQIDQILAQRKNVIKSIEDVGFESKDEALVLELSEDGISPLPKFSELPANDRRTRARAFCVKVECQFKCCHACRPTSNERTFLSLDGIARGDIPPTSISGFGFHIAGERPVAMVSTVRTLGLRSPMPILGSLSSSQEHVSTLPESQFDRSNDKQFRTEHITTVKITQPETPLKSSPFNDNEDADTTFGQPAANAYDSAAMTKRINKEPPSPPPKMPLPQNPPANITPKLSPGGKYNPFTPHNTPTTPIRSPGLGISQDDTPTDRSGRSTRNPHLEAPLGRFSIELDREGGDIGLHEARLFKSQHPNIFRTMSTRSNNTDILDLADDYPDTNNTDVFDFAYAVPAAEGTKEEEKAEAPLSEMELEESEMGFGDQPLELKDGVAVTEEAVGLHVPDVITHV